MWTALGPLFRSSQAYVPPDADSWSLKVLSFGTQDKSKSSKVPSRKPLRRRKKKRRKKKETKKRAFHWLFLPLVFHPGPQFCPWHYSPSYRDFSIVSGGGFLWAPQWRARILLPAGPLPSSPWSPPDASPEPSGLSVFKLQAFFTGSRTKHAVFQTLVVVILNAMNMPEHGSLSTKVKYLYIDGWLDSPIQIWGWGEASPNFPFT